MADTIIYLGSGRGETIPLRAVDNGDGSYSLVAARRSEKTNTTGAAAMAAGAAVPDGERRRVLSVSVKLDTAPASAGSLTIALKAHAGALYDIVFKAQEMMGVVSLLWLPDGEIFLEGGDILDVVYANPDLRTYGVQITMEVV